MGFQYYFVSIRRKMATRMFEFLKRKQEADNLEISVLVHITLVLPKTNTVSTNQCINPPTPLWLGPRENARTAEF